MKKGIIALTYHDPRAATRASATVSYLKRGYEIVSGEPVKAVNNLRRVDHRNKYK